MQPTTLASLLCIAKLRDPGIRELCPTQLRNPGLTRGRHEFTSFAVVFLSELALTQCKNSRVPGTISVLPLAPAAIPAAAGLAPGSGPTDPVTEHWQNLTWLLSYVNISNILTALSSDFSTQPAKSTPLRSSRVWKGNDLGKLSSGDPTPIPRVWSRLPVKLMLYSPR